MRFVLIMFCVFIVLTPLVIPRPPVNLLQQVFISDLQPLNCIVAVIEQNTDFRFWLQSQELLLFKMIIFIHLKKPPKCIWLLMMVTLEIRWTELTELTLV